MHETGYSKPVPWADSEGWDGEGGGRGVQDGLISTKLVGRLKDKSSKSIYSHNKQLSDIANTQIANKQILNENRLNAPIKDIW